MRLYSLSEKVNCAEAPVEASSAHRHHKPADDKEDVDPEHASVGQIPLELVCRVFRYLQVLERQQRGVIPDHQHRGQAS